MTKIHKLSPKREPLSRLWFMGRGYTKADPKHTNHHVIWLHPKTNALLQLFLGDKYTLFNPLDCAAEPFRDFDTFAERD